MKNLWTICLAAAVWSSTPTAALARQEKGVFVFAGDAGYRTDSPRSYEKTTLGDDHGLTDLKGKELVPAIYAGIRYLGHGLYLLKQRLPDPEKRFDCADEKLLFNSDFKSLKPTVPSGSSFERILWLGKVADANPDLVLRELPEDSLLIYRRNNNIGICDINGKEILPADYLWAAAVSEDIVSLRKSDGVLYTFNIATQKLQKLACQNVRSDIRLVFHDGLAVFATTATQSAKSMWGYMNTAGEVVIEPKFDIVWPFFEGLACVRVPTDSGGAHNELIDKTGKLVTLPGLKVVADIGPFTEVRDELGYCGIIDRNFQFVVKPLYSSITTQTESPSTFAEYGTWDSPEGKPIFYYAKQISDGKNVILSPDGSLVFEMPSTVPFPRTPLYVDGLFACGLGPGVSFDKATYLNMKGERVSAPYSHLSTSPDISYRKIAPGILLKTIAYARDKREASLLDVRPYPCRKSRIYPEAPRTKNLREYICEPLRPAVDLFSDGQYQKALEAIRQAKLDERRDPQYQPLYLRGMCL